MAETFPVEIWAYRDNSAESKQSSWSYLVPIVK